MKNQSRVSCMLDGILSKSWITGFLVFLCAQAHQVQKLEEQLQTGWLLRTCFYLICGAVYAAYAYRFARREIARRQPMLWTVGGMFTLLALITRIFGGASGYWIDWHAAFALMLLLDMGLQREKKAVLTAFSGGLSLWVLLNIGTVLLFPQGLNGPSTGPDFAPEWLLGSRVFYYRTVFAALGMELVRVQALDGKGIKRTFAVLLICTLNVLLQGGGTAILGFALMIGLLLVFSRHRLPRYATPATMALLSLLLFVGINFFHIQNLFGTLINDLLGKSMTLTGRTEVWEAAVALIRKSPVTGIGLLPVAYMRQYLGYAHTHNQILELWLHGGLLTLSFYAAMILLADRKTKENRAVPAVKTAAILLMTFLFMGTVEIFHNDPMYYPLFILLSRAELLSQKGGCTAVSF